MALVKLRHVPSWVRPFLMHIKQGKSEKVAANLSQTGTAAIRRQVEKDPKFKEEYEAAWDARPAEQPKGF